MGMVQLPDKIERVVEEAKAEEDELRQAVELGSADIDAGRFTTVAGPENERDLRDGMRARLRSRLSADG